MKAIAQASKEAIVKKALLQKGVNLKLLAKEYDVGYSSIHKWIRQFKSVQSQQFINSASKPVLTQAEQVQHVLATASLDEHSMGVYCRENGLYTTQINEWKANLMKENSGKKDQKLLNELKQLRLENKALKKDLSRKDRALAETTALLILKKKADFLLKDLEGD